MRAVIVRFVTGVLTVMHRQRKRTGAINSFYALIIGALVLLVILGAYLLSMGKPARTSSGSKSNSGNGPRASNELFMYCAAGIRTPVVQIVADYEREYGVSIRLQYGGSNTLLGQIQIAKTGDLYLAADDDYVKLAQEKKLVQESLPIGTQWPALAVQRGNPKNIRSIDDLLRDDVRTALGSPDQPAVGKATRNLLNASGHWERLEKHVTDTGAFLPTVPEVANSVKIGSVDAGVIWNTTLPQYRELELVPTPELEAGIARITLGVLASSGKPTEALRFARYMTARDKGLATFKDHGFVPVDGDEWTVAPEINFY